VISVGSGDYDGEIDKPLTFVGEGPEETNIIVTEFSTGSTTTRFFNTTISSSNGPIHSSDLPTLQFEDSVVDAGIGDVDPPNFSDTLSADIKLKNCTVNGTIWTPAGGSLYANNTILNGRLELWETSIKDCIINSRIHINARGENNTINDSVCEGIVSMGGTRGSVLTSLDCTNTAFSGGLQIRGHTRLENCSANGIRIGKTPSITGDGANLTAINTEISGSESFNSGIKIVDYDGGRCNLELEGCTIDTQSTSAKYAIKSEHDGIPELIVDDCEIDNQILCPTHENDAQYKNTIFETNDASFDYFIEDKLDYIVNNAFIGADIRVNSDETLMFNEEAKTGNYYSVYDNQDEDGDGIIDLPRPIPGEGNVTDQYPLASPPTAEHESGVDQDVFDAVDQSGDGDVSLDELQNAVDDWGSDQQIDNVDVSLEDLRAIVDWWAS